jgi:MFS family permease
MSLNGANPKTVPDQGRMVLWNYLLHSVEGGLFVGGLAFVAANTVLPRLADILEAPAWLISLTPMLLIIGFCLPSIFMAHLLDRLSRVMPLLRVTGIFQRIPYLLTGLFLWYYGDAMPVIALYLVILAPLASGLAGGVSFIAWQELLVKTIPDTRRASALALRNVIAASIGVLAGGIIVAVLDRYPGMRGFGILHLIAFGILLVSYVLFTMIRETHHEPRAPRADTTMVNNLRGMPEVVRQDGDLRKWLMTVFLSAGIFILLPYIAIHALRVTGKPDAFLGVLVTAQMLGMIVGSAIAGYAIDKYGPKGMVIFGRIALSLTCILAAFATSSNAFVAIFFLAGMAMFISRIGQMTFSMEFPPAARRSTYLAIIAFTGLPSMLTAALVSALVWQTTESVRILAFISAGTLAAAALIATRLPNPRRVGG